MKKLSLKLAEDLCTMMVYSMVAGALTTVIVRGSDAVLSGAMVGIVWGTLLWLLYAVCTILKRVLS